MVSLYRKFLNESNRVENDRMKFILFLCSSINLWDVLETRQAHHVPGDIGEVPDSGLR
jgi:hypothetical protein